jgi:hypothetical protein
MNKLSDDDIKRLKSLQIGDFVKLKYEYLYRHTNSIETETDVFIVSFVDKEYKYISMLNPIDHILIEDVVEIIYIQSNNFEGA